MKNKKLLVLGLKYLFLALVLYYVGKFMIGTVGDLKHYDLRVKYNYIVYAYLVHLLYLMSRAFIWHFITVINKVNIGLRDAIVIWFISLLGKFIPGKVFYLGVRVYHYNRMGKSGAAVTFSFFIEYMTGIAASILLFVLSFSFIPSTAFHAYRPIGIAVSAVMLIVLHPRILGPILCGVSKLLKRSMPSVEGLKYSQLIGITLLYVLAWGLIGLGFFFVVNSVYPLPLVDYLYVSGAFALATIIGILSLFAPSGIGVREGVIIATMTQIIPTAIASIVALIARIWATSSELLWIGVAFLISLVLKKYEPRIIGHEEDQYGM